MWVAANGLKRGCMPGDRQAYAALKKKKAPGGERVPGGTEDYELRFREPKVCELTLCNRSAESREIKSV